MEHLQGQQRRASVPRIGNLASIRPEGVWRWMYCQVNSFSVGTNRSEKLRKITELIEKHDVDGVVFCEAGINWSVGPSSRDLKSFFDPYMEREIRTTGSHNIHGPRVSPLQQGGTAILLTNSLLQYAKRHTTDMRKLGRWSSWTLSHNPMHRTRVVVAYSPGQPRRGLKTVYQQQMTYINLHQLQTTPLQLFITDLIKQLSIWKAAGDRLILFIDANESITRGATCKALSEIGMSEVTHEYWDKGAEPNTHISGSSSIDGIFTSDDIETTNFLSLSFDESVGDHRTMILEVSTASTIGHFQGKIVRPSSRRLTTKQPRVVAAYNNRLEQQYQSHRIPDRLHGLLALACSTEDGVLGEEISRDIQTIYTEMDQLKTNAEANCRKIAKPTLPYSPSSSFWYDQIHAYRVLIRIKSGKAGRGTDISRAMRTAHRKRIPTPRVLTIRQCWDGIKVARAHQQQILSHTAMGERKNYLQKQAERALNNGDVITQKAIHQRMRQEHDKSIWKRIKRVTNTSTSRACMEVQVHNGQSTITHSKKADIEQAIQQEIKTRFALGNSAPISRSLLGIDLQYLGNTELAFSIINGTFSIPDELDEATKLILHEIGIMGSRVLRGEFFPALTITASDYTTYHRRLRESTSSSPSGLHLGHGKAAALSDSLASTHATQMNLIIRSGIHPTRWGTALQVLLEKVAGVCLVEKLRSIQLYEADLNWFMKFIFNDGALAALKAAEFLPEEHYSQKGSTAEDACLDKTLTFDISRQTRTPMAIMSVDAAQCYDRVHHGLMSLTWLALVQNLPVVKILLSCLGDMKIHTRTGYGDSTTYFGGHSEIPACGLGQGSKAAPASWIQISSIFVKILRDRGLGAMLLDPITKAVIHSIGCLYVDDTDLYVLASKLQTALEVLAAAQSTIMLWSSLLAATGGAIKTEKSFWSMLDYTCKQGEWQYAPFSSYPLTILADGIVTPIAQHSVTDSDKTLGVYHCPAGGHVVHLENIRKKTMEWLNQMKNGHLPPSLVWKSYRIQLWARIKYALGTLTNSLEDAESCLNELDFNLLPLLNVNRHIRTGWRKLHQSFGGVGLLHLPTEQLICRLNILQQHYGTQSTVGQKLSCSLHWLQLQLGHNDNPLLLDYSRWQHLSCRTWWVELWQALYDSPITLRLKYQKQRPPRQSDETIMQFLMDSNLPLATLSTMNRCRNHLRALFLSDIATADGKYIGQRFLSLHNPQPLDSTLSFPREQPSRTDWATWANTWRSLTSTAFKLRTPLGPWLHTPTNTWKWFYDRPSDSILYDAGKITHVYPCRLTSQTRSGNKYAYSHSVHSPTQTQGNPVTVSATQTDGEDVIISITSRSPNVWPSAETASDTFWKSLLSGGGEWMWEKFHFQNKEDTSVDWIAEGIVKGSLLWVTDGSHFPQRGPYISGAAWIVADLESEKTMACSFAERSPAASSYRAESLGLYAIHAFIHAMIDHHHISEGTIEICCDNDAALKEASFRKKRIGTSASSADIFRGIRWITSQLTAVRWSYTWVKAHMDDVLDWQDLSRAQQLNVICDNLAKTAAEDAITSSGPTLHPSNPQLLPHESSAVFINYVKQTSDPAAHIRFACGKHAAKRFLSTEMGWTAHQFDEVDWENLHQCLQSKPDGFRTWLSKQHSNFCATRVQSNRWFGTDDSRCPSCLQVEERAEHLCKCSDPGRRQLLETDTDDLVRWMSIGENTHPDIIEWVQQYIRSQDRPSSSRLEHHPHTIQDLVKSQTLIGWRNFMEGRISSHFHRLQYCHLIQAQTTMTAASWTRTFISKLLRITHSQWIFRNFVLHDKTHGLLRFKEQGAILLHLEALSLSDKNDLPKESRFLLEFDIGRLHQADFETQCYWVAAVNAARSAVFGVDTSTVTNSSVNHVLPSSHQRQPTRERTLPWFRPPTENRPHTHRPSPSSLFTREDTNRNIKPG